MSCVYIINNLLSWTTKIPKLYFISTPWNFHFKEMKFPRTENFWKLNFFLVARFRESQITLHLNFQGVYSQWMKFSGSKITLWNFQGVKFRSRYQMCDAWIDVSRCLNCRMPDVELSVRLGRCVDPTSTDAKPTNCHCHWTELVVKD